LSPKKKSLDQLYEPEEEPQKENIEIDNSFLRLMMISEFTLGFKKFLDISLLSLYKDVLMLEPG
jgi:hypothetical protein